MFHAILPLKKLYQNYTKHHILTLQKIRHNLSTETISNTTADSNQSSGATILVEQGKTYRIRLIAATTLYIGYFAIPYHTMTLVEVEGDLIKPIQVDFVELMPGQRYSILVKMDQEINEYTMQFQARYRKNGPKNGLSILKYQGSLPSIPKYIPLPPEQPWIHNLEPLEPFNVPPNPNPPIILTGRQIKLDRKIKWTINNISFQFPSTPLLNLLQSNIQIPPESKPLARFKKNELVDFVFENERTLGGVCEVHPWHLHGHVFIPISSGFGKFPNNETKLGNVYRDTVGVYGGDGECGWTRIRFRAENVGVWAVHCHIIAHYAMGMGGAFVVEEEDVVSFANGKRPGLMMALTVVLISVII
jgi:L-ascorbate oxidase